VTIKEEELRGNGEPEINQKNLNDKYQITNFKSMSKLK